jgi:hypothetical protein
MSQLISRLPLSTGTLPCTLALNGLRLLPSQCQLSIDDEENE